MPTAVAPDSMMDFAETTSRGFEALDVESMSGEQFRVVLRLCELLRVLNERVRQSFETALGQGVDARAFAAKYQPSIPALERMRETAARVIRREQARAAQPLREAFIAEVMSLANEWDSLRQFLAGAVSAAQPPSRPIDWERVQDAEDAYGRGEMKPFTQSAKPGQGG